MTELAAVSFYVVPGVLIGVAVVSGLVNAVKLFFMILMSLIGWLFWWLILGFDNYHRIFEYGFSLTTFLSLGLVLGAWAIAIGCTVYVAAGLTKFFEGAW